MEEVEDGWGKLGSSWGMGEWGGVEDGVTKAEEFIPSSSEAG
jgi:hypothetical protein